MTYEIVSNAHVRQLTVSLQKCNNHRLFILDFCLRKNSVREIT